MATLKIEGLSRDVLKKRAHVTIVWEDNPERRLGLPVPYDCEIGALKAETKKALQTLIEELSSATIIGP